MALVLPPLFDPREHRGVPKHVRYDTENDLVSADVKLLQRARLPPQVSLDAVLHPTERVGA